MAMVVRRKYVPKKPYKKGLTKPQKRMVKKMIDNEIEDKYTDSVYTATNQAYNTGLTTPRLISACVQGTTATNRIGDKVILKRVDIRVSVYHNVSNTATDAANNYRIIVFKWNVSTNISTPATSGILAYPSAALTLDYGVNSPYLWTNKQEKNFSILYDQKFVTQTDSGNHHHIKLKKFLGNVVYEPGATTGRGHIYLMILNDDGLAVAPTLTIGYISRTIYQDA